MKKPIIDNADPDLSFLSNELYLELFVDWANSNPDLFNKKYSKLSENLTKSTNSKPETIAALIEKIPQLFPKWLSKADRLIGSARINELKNIASILEEVLNKEFDDEVIEHSRKKMIPIAKEYLDIVNTLIEPQMERPFESIGFKRSNEKK